MDYLIFHQDKDGVFYPLADKDGRMVSFAPSFEKSPEGQYKRRQKDIKESIADSKRLHRKQIGEVMQQEDIIASQRNLLFTE
jgi:hypothetical protein